MISILIRVNFQMNIESEIYVIESIPKRFFLKLPFSEHEFENSFIEEVGLST